MSEASQAAWELPAGVTVFAVETETELDDASTLLDAAVLCGIDAEWPPDETLAEAPSGGPPHATLVQLALWLPPGAPTPPQHALGDSGGPCVLLLDLLALPPAAAKRALQSLFRNRACLKLGFGLVHDLRAIAAALGDEGGSCIAVVEPAADVGSVHRFLRHRHVAGVHKAVDLGLSGLVETQLGRPLDKALQCSAWGERPLSAEQRQYAAADAACLLAVLASCIAAVGQPEEWPMVEPTRSPEAREEVSEVAPQAAGVPAGAEAAAEAAAAEGGADGNAPPPPQQQQAAAAARDALLGGCSLQQLRAAAAAWGVRLEISGARLVKRGGRRGQRKRQQQRLGMGIRELDAGTGFPSHVPWMDAQRQMTGEPRFICDVMVEGLSRQLRLCGFDTEALQHSMEKAPRHAIYRAMVERAEAEGRVVLTRDRTFVSAGYSDQAYLVQCDTKQEQLEEVLQAFGLVVQHEDLLTRCARCNGEFIPEPFPAALLPPDHGVPPGILEQRAEFWVCARCSGVFWQGNQYSRAKGQMVELIGRLSLK